VYCGDSGIGTGIGIGVGAGVGKENVEGGTIGGKGREGFGDVVEEFDGVGGGGGDFGVGVEEGIGEARVFGGIGNGVEDFLGVFEIWGFEDRIWFRDGFWGLFLERGRFGGRRRWLRTEQRRRVSNVRVSDCRAE